MRNTLALVPDRLFIKLTTSAYLQLGDGAAATDQVSINWGSIYQPFGSSVIQPYGYDQLKALYGRYLVRGARVNLLIENINASNSRMLVGIQATPSSSAPYALDHTSRS